MEVLLVIYVIFGGLLISLSIPLLRNKIPPNGAYGFRVKKTLADPQIWYAVNQHFSKRLLLTGIALVFTAITLYFLPGITLDQYALGVLLVFALFFGVGLAQSVHFMNTL